LFLQLLLLLVWAKRLLCNTQGSTRKGQSTLFDALLLKQQHHSLVKLQAQQGLLLLLLALRATTSICPRYCCACDSICVHPSCRICKPQAETPLLLLLLQLLLAQELQHQAKRPRITAAQPSSCSEQMSHSSVQLRCCHSLTAACDAQPQDVLQPCL
jgi:hypothetical protein